MARKHRWTEPLLRSINENKQGLLWSALCSNGERDGGTCSTGSGATAMCGGGDAPTGEDCINGEFPGGTCVPGGID